MSIGMSITCFSSMNTLAEIPAALARRDCEDWTGREDFAPSVLFESVNVRISPSLAPRKWRFLVGVDGRPLIDVNSMTSMPIKMGCKRRTRIIDA
mmetsp:Transcript_59704/g.69788  ORF Transcript_59704/g.69788 Transcript_59704/m.69788 type:complete len:95 (+) Transcript_59704:2202-2486(+)